MPARSNPTLRSSILVAGGIRILLIAFFVWMVGRQWHPYYGLTRFLECDPEAAATMVPSLRGTPLYVHSYPGSYDGFFYAEIATDPSVRTPGLRTSVDDLGYRARRILLSAIAWVAGGGDPVRAVHAYVWLDVIGWIALAALLWRLLPCSDWRATVAWIGVMFATGTLVSVRLALPDLAALALTAAGLMQIEAGRRGGAAALLGLAGLARETAVLGAAALLPRSGETRRQRRRALGWAAATVVPLALWVCYLWLTVGSSGPGLRNFAWPFTEWAKKLEVVFAAARTTPGHWLAVSSLGCILALSTQWLYLALHPARDNPWWRTGAGYAVLMIVLGSSVWGDDLPGAAVRVLLPLGLAFNVLAVRARAPLAWLLLGNAWVLGGVPALWPVYDDPHELAAGRFSAGTFVAHTDARWFAVETHRDHRWAWCQQDGTVTIETWPRERAPQKLVIALQAFTPREIVVRSSDRVLWRGRVGRTPQSIELPADVDAAGRLRIDLHSDAPPERENDHADARELGFSVSSVRLE